VIVDCAVYEQGHRRPGELPVEHAGEASADGGAFVWIGLYEPTEDEFDAVRREFDLHELAVEDAITAHQRPKLEAYDDSLFVVLKPRDHRDPDHGHRDLRDELRSHARARLDLRLPGCHRRHRGRVLHALPLVQARRLAVGAWLAG
jgi:Mg2+ and Co2+ transporter CorA